MSVYIPFSGRYIDITEGVESNRLDLQLFLDFWSQEAKGPCCEHVTMLGLFGVFYFNHQSQSSPYSLMINTREPITDLTAI